MSKFIEIEGELVLKSSIFYISEVRRYKKDEESLEKYAFSVDFGYSGYNGITVKKPTKEEAEAERNRIIKELESDNYNFKLPTVSDYE